MRTLVVITARDGFNGLPSKSIVEPIVHLLILLILDSHRCSIMQFFVKCR